MQRATLFFACRIVLSLAGSLAILASCASPPGVGRSRPWYSTPCDLALKAEAHRDHTQSLVNRQGLLLYHACLPWDDSESGRWNYIDSHDIADAPAWHGLEMASLAFEWAVTGESRDLELRRMADGLGLCYEITGQEGALVRSYLADYTGPRLAWMETPDERPFSYWTQGTQGRWYREGLAKNHLNLAVFGCAMPLALERRGALELTDETRDRLVAVMVPAVRRWVEGGFRIRNIDGSLSQFGDLRPDLAIPRVLTFDGYANGFNRALALHLLVSASPYDESIRRVYESVASDWASGIGNSMEFLGELVTFFGRVAADKPSVSDMSAFGLASLSILLQEDRREVARHVRRGLTGLWEYMRYEANPFFTLPYRLVRPIPGRVDDVVLTLRQFPMPADKRDVQFKTVDTRRVQPLHNRPPSSNYWKSSPYRRVLASKKPPVVRLSDRTGDEWFYSSQDYNLAYWLGRFIGAVPER